MAEVQLESVKSLPNLEMEFSSGTPARPVPICESTSNLHACSVSAVTCHEAEVFNEINDPWVTVTSD